MVTDGSQNMWVCFCISELGQFVVVGGGLVYVYQLHRVCTVSRMWFKLIFMQPVLYKCVILRAVVNL